MELLENIIPSIRIDSMNRYSIKILGKELTGFIYSCRLEQDIEYLLDLLSKAMDKYRDSIIAIVPRSIVPSIKVLALSTLYTYMLYYRRRHRIRNRALLLLSIAFTRRQLDETIDIINKYLRDNFNLLIICYREHVEALTNELGDLLRHCRECSASDWRIGTPFINVYGIEPPADMDTMEKTVITMITRHYLSLL